MYGDFEEDIKIKCDKCGEEFINNERNVLFHNSKHVFEDTVTPKYQVGDVLKYYDGLCQIISRFIGLKFYDKEPNVNNMKYIYSTDKKDYIDGGTIYVSDFNKLYKSADQLEKEKESLLNEIKKYNLDNKFECQILMDKEDYSYYIKLKEIKK